jgi:hypothetical protein
MRRVRNTVLTLGLLALAVSPALAQRQRGPRPAPGPAQLLAMPEVLTEIKATDEQKAAITKISDKYKDDIAAARTNMDREKMADLRKQENADVEKAVPDVFKADQVKRLHQLGVQASGLGAFAKEDVQTALKLTDDQKKNIKETADDLQKDVQDLFQGVQGDRSKMAEAFAKSQTMSKDALDKVVNGLTDDQKKSWKDLTGEKFDFPAPMRRRPGGN